MKQIFLKRFFSITLFLSLCPSNFINSQEPNPETKLTKKPHEKIEQIEESHEIFEELMVEARNQTETIGFCIQQLLQTLDAGKLKITKSEKAHITEQLQQIQELTSFMLEKVFVQNSINALCEGILINHTLIDYLLTTVQKDIKQIQVEKLHDLLTKKSSRHIPEEMILRLAMSNKEKVEKLVYAVDHIGLTWINSLYRNLKKYNAYSIAKGGCILGITALATGVILCRCGLASSYVGDTPEKLTNQLGWSVYERDEKGQKIYEKRIFMDGCGNTQETMVAKSKVIDQSTAGYIQRLTMIQHDLQNAGILATGALLTLNYKDLFTSMYKDAFNWMYDSGAKKIIEYDKKLQGISKANSNTDGCEKVYFKDMVGCEELEQLAKKIANFMKHPERYERAQIEEHRGILLYGPPQTGKTLFAKALRTLIEDELEDTQKVHFIDAKKLYDLGYTIEYIFWYASYYAPCILFFDELDLMGGHRDKNPAGTSQLLTCMQGIDTASKQIIVIGATNRPEQLDKALLVDGRFGKIIHIEYPKYENRKAYLVQQLEKRCIQLDPEYINYIAQETDGCSYNNLKRIITEAIILSSIETRPVNQQDFEKTLDSEVRKIQPMTTMSEQERKVIATYQAGKALARHLLKTNQEVVKITINPVIKEVKPTEVALIIDSTATKASDNEKLVSNKKDQRVKLGEVFTKSSNNHQELLSDTEQEKECLALLAGTVALELITHEHFTQCNKHDRAEALQMIYGMINQGEKVDDKIKTQALEIKEQYEQKIKALLQEHVDLLEKIISLLVEQNTIDRYQWHNLMK